MEDRNKLILDNIGLVYEGLKQMNFKWRNQEEYEDAFMLGVTGLIKGARRFDKSKSNSSYLVSSIKREIANQYHYNTAKKRLGEATSLNEKISDDGTTRMDLLISPINIEKEVIDSITLNEILDIVFNHKKIRSITIFLKYYGIISYPMTIPELAKEYGISCQAIQQIIARMISYIRKELKKNEKSKKNITRGFDNINAYNKCKCKRK